MPSAAPSRGLAGKAAPPSPYASRYVHTEFDAVASERVGPLGATGRIHSQRIERIDRISATIGIEIGAARVSDRIVVEETPQYRSVPAQAAEDGPGQATGVGIVTFLTAEAERIDIVSSTRHRNAVGGIGIGIYHRTGAVGELPDFALRSECIPEAATGGGQALETRP